MNRTLYRAFGALGLSLAIAGAATGVDAATFTVNSAKDAADAKPGDGKCATAAGECTLRAAVEEANASTLADEIEIPSGTYTLAIPSSGPNYAQSGDLFLNGEIEISGESADDTIIDGGGVDRVFQTELQSSVEISDVTIRGGLANGADGGGILNRGNLVVEDARVTGNRSKADPLNANGRGGGIANDADATLQLRNVRVDGNTADGRGGGISNAGSLKVFNGKVTGNASLTDDGGGVYNQGQALFVLTTIDGNKGRSGAGLENVDGTLQIMGATFSGNQASAAGGGLRTSGQASLINSTISGNQAASSGGGIENRAKGQLTLNNVTIAGNGSAGNGSGGLATESTATVKTSNSILAGSKSSKTGSDDCSGTIQSLGHNLIQTAGACSFTGAKTGDLTGSDPKLGPLAANDGPTATHALLEGSPAIDAGNPAEPTGEDGRCAGADQRGEKRATGKCDIGSFEVGKPLK